MNYNYCIHTFDSIVPDWELWGDLSELEHLLDDREEERERLLEEREMKEIQIENERIAIEQKFYKSIYNFRSKVSASIWPTHYIIKKGKRAGKMAPRSQVSAYLDVNGTKINTTFATVMNENGCILLDIFLGTNIEFDRSKITPLKRRLPEDSLVILDVFRSGETKRAKGICRVKPGHKFDMCGYFAVERLGLSRFYWDMALELFRDVIRSETRLLKMLKLPLELQGKDIHAQLRQGQNQFFKLLLLIRLARSVKDRVEDMFFISGCLLKANKRTKHRESVGLIGRVCDLPGALRQTIINYL